MLTILKFLKRPKWRVIFTGSASIVLMFSAVFALLGFKPVQNTKIVPTLKNVTEIDEKKDSKFGALSEKKETGNEEKTYFLFKKKNRFEDFDDKEKSVAPAFDFNSVQKAKSKRSLASIDTVSSAPIQRSVASNSNLNLRPRGETITKPTRRVREGQQAISRGGGQTVDLSQTIAASKPVEKEKVGDVFNFGSQSESSSYESTSFESEWIKIELNQDTKVKSGDVSTLSFRLNDDIVVNGESYSKGSTLLGQATFKKNRILVSIHSIKDLKNHNTASIVMEVYDVDKSEGILFDRTANKKGGKIVKDAVRGIAREVPFGGIIRGATNGLSGSGKASTTLRKGSMYFLKN